MSCGVDGQGKRIRKFVYAGTKGEVREKLKAVQDAQEAGTVEPSKESLATFLDRWLESVKPIIVTEPVLKVTGPIKPATYACYESTVRLYVKPGLGDVTMARLNPAVIQAHLKKLETDGHSGRVLQLAYSVLRMAFKLAVEWKVLTVSPLPSRAPKYKSARRTVWDLPHFHAFLGAVAGDRLEALYVLALTTALRQGEMLGLQWKDVDLTTGDVLVQWNLVEEKGRILGLMRPKTEAGMRSIVLPAVAVAALKAHRARLLAKGLAACPQVFPNRDKNYFLKTNITYEFQRAVAKAGVPRITFHDMRHTAASVLLASGLDMKKLQEQLGHADFALTANTYSHVLPAGRTEAASRMDSVFGEKSGS